MAKPRFFVHEKVDEIVRIEGSDARHIASVLRLTPGNIIEVIDGGLLADVRITEVERELVIGEVVGRRAIEVTLPEVALFQGLPKTGKLDVIVRQATEIGVSRVYPVITERVVVKLDTEKAERKGDRWQKIAAEAAKQSHRTHIPHVSNPLSWNDALQELKQFDQIIVFWEEEHTTELFEVLKASIRSSAVVIGPEGGLSEREIADLKSIGADIVTLGEAILRTETAGPVAVALMLYEFRRGKNLAKP